MFPLTKSRLRQLFGTRPTESGSRQPSLHTDPADRLYVEFIGPPGVGKTTTFDTVVKNNRSLLKYVDFRRTVNLQPTEVNTEFDDTYQALASHKLDQISKADYSALDKLKVLAYFHRVVEGDRVVMLHNRGYTVISDEGLLHNFGKALEQEILHGRIPSSFLARRVVINCHAPAERIAEQILKRHRETGNLLPQHKNKTVQQLALDQEEICQHYWKFRDLLLRSGMPVLDIDTSANTDLNVKDILEFISNPRMRS